MNKKSKIIFSQSARLKLLEGITAIKDTISVTLGPNGKNVAISSLIGSSKITNDGSLSIKDIELKDCFSNIGASIAKSLAKEIKKTSGDGSTTAIILLHSIVENSIKNITSGTNPIDITKGLEKGLKTIVERIEKSSQKIDDIEQITSIASSNKEVSTNLAKVFEKVGKNGIVSIKMGKTQNTQLSFVDGFNYLGGYLSSYFCTNQEKQLVELSSPLILITDKKIGSIHEILPIIQEVSSKGKELLIIAEELEGETLSTLVINKLQGRLLVAATKAPAFGDRRKAILEDIAILTGATYISKDKGMDLKKISIDDLGSAKKITLSSDETTIISGLGNKQKLETRIKQIKKEIELEKDEYDIEKLEERVSKLTKGVALIEVGAPTESELKQKRDIYDRALKSTRSALLDGVVIGGGIALANAYKDLESMKISPNHQIGIDILKEAIFSPIKTIIENQDKDSGIIIEKIKQSNEIGFNAITQKTENFLTSKILDPTLVVKNIIIFAVSSAKTAILAEVLIKKEE